jgi:hypothetical protein
MRNAGTVLDVLREGRVEFSAAIFTAQSLESLVLGN